MAEKIIKQQPNYYKGNREMTKDLILQQLKEYYVRTGEITRRRFNKDKTVCSGSVVRKRFGRSRNKENWGINLH